MSDRKWREEFVATCARLGVPNALRDRLLREAPAIQRGAEAECSFIGEIAAPFVKRAQAAMRRCHETADAQEPVRGHGGSRRSFDVAFGGDPRGCTVTLSVTDWDRDGAKDVQEFGVPRRGFSVRDVEYLDARQKAIWRREAKAREAAQV